MSLEDDVKEGVVTQRSELEGVAQQIFKDDNVDESDKKTNLTDEEIPLCMINDVMFRLFDCDELSPTSNFKRLKSSRNGWKMDMFRQTATGAFEVRGGGGFGEKLGKLFGRRE